MKISFVVPAFNEAAYIEACLHHIAAAVAACRARAKKMFDVELVVVDNNSTDDTAARAAQSGATVVFEPVNQISRARNTGARAASGDWLIFVDADSEVSAELLTDVFEIVEAGTHIGCGCLVAMGGKDDMPPLAWRLLKLWSWLSLRLNWAAGSFIACRADVFARLGGFSERLYAAEEIDFSRRMKRYARGHGSRFSVLHRHPLRTSNRKVRLYTEQELRAQLWRLVLHPFRALRDKRSLTVWYDGRR